ICEQECPPACIHILGPAKDEQGRPLKVHGRTYPVEFDIDTSICMSCRICVDVCPFDAIEMDNQHELSSTGRFGEMVFDKSKLLKPAEYFRAIKPAESATVDQRLEAKKPKAAPAASATEAGTPPSGGVADGSAEGRSPRPTEAKPTPPPSA
ncbi:MAG: 4Fe-4S binding protein, partial [Candidatus Omnitrophica bacterium]|nr:4Fe-4S binding protein [Candidatus Omnitrophota bacterium]